VHFYDKAECSVIKQGRLHFVAIQRPGNPADNCKMCLKKKKKTRLLLLLIVYLLLQSQGNGPSVLLQEAAKVKV